ncbi:Maf-like protein YceF [Candidatus Kinetoplastibacterium sorsogonicusi]|uniref:7-methyl-GTP pyrophosphatase n=1 Tax=Candidatus Kinetoplastidibacterium kentomonadis TaxID=1576550 RepID=A0A3Q8ERF7_9PROT|nr:nucleoside triphosphate pyrophosphatase [Candidatus Kinetoplastibacterium sorsogonicusi]AWD32560.1 Maf-like protein YceF [Candidatus Kinetoplastibacterium sorsogonicusi]
MNKSQYKLILASSSQYRFNLLKKLNLNFEVILPNVDESAFYHPSPKKLSLILSIAKAHSVQKKLSNEQIIIGSDQVGVCDGKIIGKSYDFDKAVSQLKFLSNKILRFYTSVTVIRGKLQKSGTVMTKCKIKKLTTEEIEKYLKIDNPYDVAGSIKTESLGIVLIDKIESNDPTAVLGLPMIKLIKILSNFNIRAI